MYYVYVYVYVQMALTLTRRYFDDYCRQSLVAAHAFLGDNVFALF